MILFENGLQGLADSIWQGVKGSARRVVGIDYRSEPGLIKVHQALTKDSGSTVDEFCKVGLPVSDGSNLWFSSVSGKIWRGIAGVYTLVTTLIVNPWDLDTGLTVGNYTVGTPDTDGALSLRWKPDGTKFYIMATHNSGTERAVFQFSCSTPWDITTTSYDTKFIDVTALLTNGDMWFKPDGTAVYFITYAGVVDQWDLSTAWDISTASASGDTHNASADDNNMRGIVFKSDGTKMILAGNQNNKIYEYDLSTAWDLTTVSLVQSITCEAGIAGFYVSTDGENVFFSTSENGSSGSGSVHKWVMGTGWDVSTLTDTTDNIETLGYWGLGFNPDGSSFYTMNFSTDIIYQYDLSLENLNPIILSAEEFSVPDGTEDAIVNYIYFTTEIDLYRIPLTDIALDWNLTEQRLTSFLYGDDTYHPIQKQNNRLYIGDKYVLLEINEAGVITLQSNFNVQEPERITTLIDFDTDLLVGTKDVKSAWVRRWDTESDSWYTQDEVFETEIYAFIRDDNYVYVQAGDFGRMYFYDGEKLHPDTRIPARSGIGSGSTPAFWLIPAAA